MIFLKETSIKKKFCFDFLVGNECKSLHLIFECSLHLLFSSIVLSDVFWKIKETKWPGDKCLVW